VAAKKVCRIVFAFLRLFAAMLFSHDGFAFSALLVVKSVFVFNAKPAKSAKKGLG
jgi:hypothetical protein